MKSGSYRHHSPYPTAQSTSRPRPRVNPTPQQLRDETRLAQAFRSAYQTLADLFRSDVFAANLRPDDRPDQYVSLYVDSANEHARSLFTEILVPVGNAGTVEGREEVTRARFKWRFRKARSSALVTPTDDRLGSQRAGTVSALYPGSLPPQVPPRRRLLRVPPPRLTIQPTSLTGRFVGAPQTHLDAVAQLPLDLVTLIDESQRDGIRTVLDEAIRRGYDPDMIGMQIANMVGLFPRWQQAVVNLGTRMTADGKGEREVQYRMGRYSDWLRERRGLMIARTELMTALNTGRMTGWHQQADDGLLDTDLSKKEWLSAPGACDACAALNGTVVQGIDSTFDTPFGKVASGPAHPHCFPAGTVVSGPGIVGVTERWYDGEIVEIRTVGHVVTATPNHPVLTSTGWVAAGEVGVGDDLIDDFGAQGLSPSGPDDHLVPTRIEEVACSFGRTEGVTTIAVPVAPEDFHGDGADSEISVIRAYGKLIGKVDPATHEPFPEKSLSGRNGRVSLTTQGEVSEMLGAVAGSTTSLMSERSDALSLLGGHAGHPSKHTLGSVATSDTILQQDSTDHVSADAILLGERLLARTSEITFDKVVNVRRMPFSGHVYNLQTREGWYTANGLVVHNCRCTTLLHPIRRPDQYLDER